MAQPVIVPRESEEMEFCRIVLWHVARGERVRAGDLLCEVDTGKAVFDLEAPVEGVVLDIFYAEGEEAPLLTPIAVLGEEGEESETFRPGSKDSEAMRKPARDGDVPAHESTPYRRDAAGSAKPGGIAASKAGTAGGEPRGTGVTGERGRVVGDGGRERIPASPRARRLAARQGIPLDLISGSGPGGAVVEGDVRRWLRCIGGEA